ncbi:macrophage infectivity potentiator Mip [soil metagenome]|nr:FKBP-type peptidyl-prolyl cis-trans isomerase [Chthoniobacterales bacterium]
MKQLSTLLAALIFVSTAAAQDKSPLKDERDKVSYSIGLDIGSTFKKQNMDINPDTLLRGLKDGASDSKPLLNEAEVKATMEAFSKSMREKQATIQREQGAKNLAAGEKFLEENKGKEGVKTTASGLQYKVVTEGKGESPKAADTVSVHYRGTLTSGKEFDSSHSRNAPAVFPVNGVIPGWTEGLQLMKQGSKFQFVIPPKLAYGERGAGGEIGPNETLLFDVELLEVNPTPAPTPEQATQ